jgi:hypothetical protein
MGFLNFGWYGLSDVAFAVQYDVRTGTAPTVYRHLPGSASVLVAKSGIDRKDRGFLCDLVVFNWRCELNMKQDPPNSFNWSTILLVQLDRSLLADVDILGPELEHFPRELYTNFF